MRPHFLFKAILALFFVSMFSACQNESYDVNDIYTTYGNSTEDVGTLLNKLAGEKIYFGHQSVGNNILAGIEYWEKETGIRLEKVESKDFAEAKNASLVHFRVGSNLDPISKIDEFVTLAGQIPNKGRPVAFFKFCYVDITSDTDVDALFGYYREQMLKLKESYPYICFVACTVPVMGIQRGPKELAKRILGRSSWSRSDNVNRDVFNKLVLAELEGHFPIFDLGRIESTEPQGTIATFEYEGATYPYMPDYYTYDGGHLNDFGARTVSYNLLAFLVKEIPVN